MSEGSSRPVLIRPLNASAITHDFNRSPNARPARSSSATTRVKRRSGNGHHAAVRADGHERGRTGPVSPPIARQRVSGFIQKSSTFRLARGAMITWNPAGTGTKRDSAESRTVRTLSFQFQPRRAASLDVGKVCDGMLKIALEGQVRTFSVQRSRARDAYINFTFEAPRVAGTWRIVHARALHHPRMGRALRQASIVVYQGSRGWDNYRLLHHFDRRKALDSLAGV